MHDGGGGGFSGGGGHDGGGFFGGGHHGGHDAGGGLSGGGHHGGHHAGGGLSGGGHHHGGGEFGVGGHHRHQQADFRPSDLVSPTDPVYGKRYGRQASGSRGDRPTSATGRVAMWIVLLAAFAFIIFIIWQVFAAS